MFRKMKCVFEIILKGTANAFDGYAHFLWYRQIYLLKLY